MKRFGILLLSMVLVSMNAQTNMKLTTPAYLQKGDMIAIVAPAGILKNRKHVIDKAKKLAESWGLKVVIGKHVFTQANHFAGTDEQRCQDFQEALDNPKVKAIWSARGGYGSVRILDQLDFSKFKENPKWIIGYSDITAFHNHVHNLGVETLHAMMGTSMQDDPVDIAETIETFRKALFGEQLKYTIKSSKENRKGTAEGVLVGGNIAILASMLGSDSQMNTDGKILFIEEIGEYKYAIDRMLQSLKRAGYFNKVKGIIVGDMTKIRKNTTPWGSSIEQLILDIVPNDIPVLFGFPAGHESDNRALIMGRTVKLSVTDRLSSVSFK
ncbi:muramoyltetrapeptide carboxypeptidase [Tenacibaculum sp. 190524A05c]|uniref:Muramoyltetrapeptide carboxypeptidase n=2 Tax=Tenacibaculum platacis TaxID=3137852 RepID=A0ABM9NT32_9FLAO